MTQAEAGHLREEHEENPAEPHANSKEWTAAEKAAAQAQLEGEWGRCHGQAGQTGVGNRPPPGRDRDHRAPGAGA